MNGLLLQDKTAREPITRNGEPYFGRTLCEEVRLESNAGMPFQGKVAPEALLKGRGAVKQRMREVKEEIRRERQRRKEVEREIERRRERARESRRTMRAVKEKARRREQNYTGAGERPPTRDGLPYYGRRSAGLTKVWDEEALRTGKVHRAGQVGSLLVG